ncbi:MAG TPA: hypothetical protein DCQ26_11810 [Marinilabiliales bacterium]|nr:MAG: hypothetical protein A2437_00160 [Bacteroidetes bacterium RIFOXYC2_FULL_40_12]HAM99283.1 hypothetical protein [Marinilabiliales bacterium]HBY51187.1 hypothetical protein [Marinilabiliales bacterium]
MHISRSDKPFFVHLKIHLKLKCNNLAEVRKQNCSSFANLWFERRLVWVYISFFWLKNVVKYVTNTNE